MVLLVKLGFVVLFTVSAVFNGYIFSVFWGWFIIPVFHLPKLTVVPAIGIALAVTYLTRQYDESDMDIFKRPTKLATVTILRPLVVLSLGWIIHLFM